MKKIFSAIISSPLKERLGGVLFALLATTSLWAHDFAVNGIYYNILTDKTNEVSVTHRGSFYDSYSNEYTDSVTIPSTVSYKGLTYSVTSVGKTAFRSCSGLTSVTIPNSAVTIEEYAFKDCSGLTSITIGNGVTSIGNYAFESCSGLTSVTIPNSVVTIGQYAFQKCSGLTSVTIGNGVTSIGKYAFYSCSSLTSITIPNSVVTIGEYAFSRCSSLTSIIIPNSVIGWNAFNGCSGLTSVTIGNGVTSIGKYAFKDCSSLTSITIGNGVTSIEDYAFQSCSGLTSVTIPNSVVTIGNGAFLDCSSLTSITIGNSVTSIGNRAFENTGFYNDESNWENSVLYISNCLIKAKKSLLGAYTIEDNTRLIADFAFSSCSSLTSITIPNNVTSVGLGAFSGCSHLTSITIPNSVTSIEERAFYKCYALTSVTIGNSITSIGRNAFYECFSLARTNYTGDIASWCGIKFADINANPIMYSHNFYINGKEVKDLIIPNTVDSIHNWAFSYCESLCSATIGNSVTSIGDCAFQSCSSLTSVTIPNSVVTIGQYAFQKCSSLTSVTIPNSVVTMGKYAFDCCIGLTSITIGNSVTSIEEQAFHSCSGLTSITIPNSVTSIGDYAFQSCSGLTSITIPNSVTSIGEQAFCLCSGLISVTIGNSVTSIGGYAFTVCSNLTSIIIPNSVVSLGLGTFRSCSGLKSATIGNSVTTILTQTFENCSSLRSVVIGNSVTNIVKGAFLRSTSIDTIHIKATTPPTLEDGGNLLSSSPICYIPCGTLAAYQSSSWAEQVGSFVEQCDEPVVDANKCGDNLYWAYTDGTLTITGTGTMYNYDDMDNLAPWNSIRNNIKNIVLPEGLTSIGEWAFYLCASVTSISIPEGVSSIGVRAFCNCNNLTSISIPNSVTSVGERAFYNCYNLASAILSTNLSKIDKYLFGQCRTLTAITIPNNVTAIENGAFSGCSSLDSISIEATNPPVLSGSSTFSSSPTCYIPCGTLAAYQSSSWAEQVGSFVEQCDEPVEDNKCGDNLYWAYADGTLTITGTGDMYNYDYMDNLAPWNSVSSNIKNIVLPEGLTSIGEWAFYLCASVTSISIPEGVSSIGVRAFCNCNNLTSISIPNSVTSVGERAFYNCYNLASAILSTNLSKIDKYLFGQCRALAAITIPNNVTAIENGAFSGCSSLDSVSIEAITPPTLGDGGNSFSSSPTCYIPCGTLSVYQSSSWAEQVGGFVEQCDDNDNNQSLISVTDGTLSDWDKLPAEYVSSCVHQKGASLDGLKSMKVYADERHINLLVEYKPETITSLEWTNFRIYINTDNSDLTGGCGASWSDANTDILLETAVFASGKPNPYNPAVYKWWGEVGDNSWDGWYDPTIELAQENCWGAIICEGSTPAVGNSQVIGNYIEIQIDYKRIPADWNKNQFTLGVEIDQNWDIAGLLPNASNGELGSTVLAKKLLVNVHPINAPILIDGILYEITSNEEPLTAEVYACTDYTIAEVDIPASITHEGQIYDVTSIGNNAFSACTRLTSITIPNSVMSIGDAAFFACFGLTEVTIPNSVTSIGELAFYNCRSLASVTLEATTPPTLGGYSFSSSPTCYILCGTLAVYQSSSWAEQVGGFVEQCDDNDNNQSLVSVTDATLSDWDNLPMEYLFESKCVEGASWDALKSVKVYADLTYINLVVEWDTEIVTDLSSVPFHVYLNVDNDAPTGGFGDQWVKPNIDLLLEGYFYLDGNPCAYQPDVALYAGTPLANEWAWDWTTIEALAASQLITKGVMEIQIEYGKLPVKLENTFTVGFDIQQSWCSVGVLPNAAAGEAGNMILAEKMLVRINNVNAPTSIENTHSPSSITNTQKLLRNGQLLIIRDGKTYTIMGAEIK